MRKCGVFINISSLPSEYGIGGLGSEINYLTDKLSAAEVKIWQILPITAIGQGNSPYSGESAFAGNYLYIDPVAMHNAGYIDKACLDNAKYHGAPYTVDYDYVKISKRKLVEAAQLRRYLYEDSLNAFIAANSYWLEDYALFMTIKSQNSGKAWWEWSKDLAAHDKSALAEFKVGNADTIEYYYIEQFLFDEQWRCAKSYAHNQKIEIMGDMPIYVSRDSVDVWANRGIFMLDCDYKPTEVAGVPPDYFAIKGQLWGNPIYNYAAMQIDNYSWFASRMKRMFELYDICRFDHFRAVSEYWSVPYGAPDATQGVWRSGGGEQLMSAITDIACGEIVAEDLGLITDDVINLRKSYGLKGMRVIQFGYDGDDSLHTPHNYERDIVAYTGTHDNNTLYGWMYELTPDKRDYLCDYIGATRGLDGGAESTQIWAVIRTLLTSVADYAIMPLQDLLGWGADTRLNIPGVAEQNWRVRFVKSNFDSVKWNRLNKLITLSKRN